MLGVSLTSTDNARPVTAALAFFTGASNLQSPVTAIATASVVVPIPMMIMVLVFQQRIVAGLTNGAIKGSTAPHRKSPTKGRQRHGRHHDAEHHEGLREQVPAR